MTPKTVFPHRVLILALASLAAALPGAAAARSGDKATGMHDPLEGLNRKTYAFNQVIDHLILGPIVEVYIHVLPKPVRKAVHNLMTELSEPAVFANDVLQLKPGRAARTTARFMANATVGVGGLVDTAARMGLPHRDNDFGTTLAHWGMAEGPYIVLPLFGPSTFRDGIGTGVDTSWDLTRFVSYGAHSTPIKTTITVLSGVDERAEAAEDLKGVEASGTDPYATLRALYLQNRRAEIWGEQAPRLEDLPELDDPGAPAEPAPAEPSAASAPATSVEPPTP